MNSILDFFGLVKDEVASLLSIVPEYITVVFVASATFSLILAAKRAIVG